MMVETILESSQDFGMSNGALPQWKRELLQRRAARSRGSAPPVTPPPPPPPPLPPPLPPADEEDEELRYGPGIVKRLKSRYLSLALRDAPRRRPSVLRRATSLEHLLDVEERAPPVPAPRPSHPHARPPRPISVAAPPASRPLAARRESVKRARSVDALSRLERDEPPPPSPSPPPPPLAPRPALPRTARPPRRPTPLLRETERPPPDLVRSTLRKFEGAPPRRPQPAARVSAVLRGLEPSPRTSTPEPILELPVSSPSPPPGEPPAPQMPESGGAATGARVVSRAALEGIARAGSTTRYSFESPLDASHLPPLAATNPVLVGRARRVGVIRPMPAPPLRPDPEVLSNQETLDDLPAKIEEAPDCIVTPPPAESEPPPSVRLERREPPPSAVVEPIPRVVSESVRPESPRRPSTPPSVYAASPEPKPAEILVPPALVNGHACAEPKVVSVASRIGTAGIEKPWSGSGNKQPCEPKEKEGVVLPWGATRRTRAPPQATTSVVFNFSDRKEVPDYVENDGIILRGSRRNRIKAGEPGVVVLRPEALTREDACSDDEIDCGPPSPCAVRFCNDNVLINGRSSMPAKPDRDRIAKLKLQFDDSLTRTFEYPSETSMCEDSPPTASAPAPAPASPPPATEPQLMAPLAANTHIVSAALSRYTPSKTLAAAFQLGVTRTEQHEHHTTTNTLAEAERSAPTNEEESGDARPCGADAARSWTEARTHATDLLF